MKLDGINAVITGAASGIGLAVAEALLARKCRVILADIETERGHAEVERLRGGGADALFVQVDVTDQASVQALADRAFAELGAIHFVMNNAGVGTGGPLHTLNARNWDWVFAVNLKSILWAAHAFVPRLLAQGAPARIANTASEHGLGLPPRGGMATPYTASKHAVIGLTEAMRRDYQGSNISVCAIVPGLVSTGIWNPFRNRQSAFGGPRSADPAMAATMAAGLPAKIAAERILSGLEADEFFVLTHGRDIDEVHNARSSEISAALARFKSRYGADD